MIYWQLFSTFFTIGLFTFGGGYAMLPLIEQKVLAHGWMSQEELINFIAVSEATPGPFGINVSTYVGTETGGFWGAVCATTGVILPSFIVILIVVRIIDRFRSSKIVQGIMAGLKPAVVALIAHSLLSVGSSALFPQGIRAAYMSTFSFWCSVVILITAIILLKKKVHPILIIVITALMGIAAGYLG